MPPTQIPFVPRTKLRSPRLPDDLLLRPRLLERLDRPQTLTLIVAPAGYGKTTLVSSWLAQRERPFAWLSLESADNTLVAFLAALVAAVQRVCPELSGALFDLLRDSTSELAPMGVLPIMLNCLDQLEQDFVLVLDDFHWIADPAVLQVVWGLLTYPPRPLRLVLTARYDPPIPPRIRCQGAVIEIRAREMGFTPDETSAFLRQAVALPMAAQSVSTLVEQAKGWAVPLRLFALAARPGQDAAALEDGLRRCERSLLDYLEAEVTGHLPAEVQTFLLCTSLLPQLNAALCDAVIDTVQCGVDSAATLEMLAQAGLFLEALDQENAWYQYHPLFRTLLQRRLRMTYAAPVLDALEQRAKSCYAQHRSNEITCADTFCADITCAPVRLATNGSSMQAGAAKTALQSLPGVTLEPMAAIGALAPAHVERSLHELLTFREMDVLLLLNRRLTNKEIAHELGVASETVRQHTVNIYRKLGVENRRQAIVRASAMGLPARPDSLGCEVAGSHRNGPVRVGMGS